MKLLLSILNFAVLYLCVVESQYCDKVTGTVCSCKGPKGTIDLSPLATGNNEPRFKDVEELSGTYWYSFSPCGGFDEGDCKGVSGCQTDNSSFYTIGKPETSNFNYDEEKDRLSMTFIANVDEPRQMHVFLVCDPNEEGSLNVTGATPMGRQIYEMTLTSKYCCFQANETTTVATPTTTPAPPTTTLEPDTTSEEPDTTSGSETTEPSGPTESEPTSSGSTEPASGSTEPPASGSTEPVTGSSMPASDTTVPATSTPNPDMSTPSSSQSVHVTGVIALVTSIILYKSLI